MRAVPRLSPVNWSASCLKRTNPLAAHLLDVNVLIALMDPAHEFHPLATAWFKANRSGGWATCPSTESGFIRILSNPKYPNVTLSPNEAAKLLVSLVQANSETHRWWTETASLRDNAVFDLAALTGSRQITDTWLLAVAVANEGKLATCDQRLGPVGVRAASTAHIALIA